MKKIYTLVLSMAISVAAFSQLVVVGTGFDNYAGTSATAQSGWYISWHSTSSPSYYTSAGNFGVAAPSYKYEQDSVVVITPMYQKADTLSFWCKGNGVPFADTNELHIYHSADSLYWAMFVNRDSLPISGTTLKYGLPSANGWIMFVFRKYAGGNLAFDDVSIISYTAIGINETENSSSINISPTISENGIFTIHNLPAQAGSLFTIQRVEVYNTVGEKMRTISGEVKSLNLSDLPSGIYFLKLKPDSGIETKKIVIAR